MNTQNETDAMLRGQAQILQYIYGALDGMAIRCCVELRIADIINTHGRPTTLSEISTAIGSPSINVDGLERLMKFLVHRKFNRVFNEVMACSAKITTDVIVSYYKDGFLGSKGTVVDVGGGIGTAISEIVKAYPHLKGINL
ncbi:hypothetical protein L1987_38008 [Smallanthus sonchifolius]|uniref:Uncharacterized protein n=1 Tax=Smallanthus sonchifolius TaxID=185202 RepID=A0ACB9HJA7_9ASTR|nr:hypothetical protein L1987_38008 [Smallanthus sonchifolius]